MINYLVLTTVLLQWYKKKRCADESNHQPKIGGNWGAWQVSWFWEEKKQIQNLCNQFYKLLPKFSLVPLIVISSHIISGINLCQSFSIRLVFFSKIWRSDFLFILSYDIDEYDIVFLKWQVFWYFYTSLSMLFYFYHRLKDLLRTRLIECGWRDQLKQHCKGKMYYLLTEHCKGKVYYLPAEHYFMTFNIKVLNSTPLSKLSLIGYNTCTTLRCI